MRFGHGIPAGRTERATAQKTTQSEKQAAHRTVSGQGFDGIGRARRREPARGGPTLDCTLIGDHEADEAPVGRASCRSTAEIRSLTSRVSWAYDRAAMSGRAPIRYQPAGRGWPAAARVDSAARSCRRMRLRTTDEPMARPIAKATRGGEADGSWRNVHQSTPARARRPSCDSRAKTSRSRMRQIKPTACGDPWHGGSSTRLGRPGCSSGSGSRACVHDDGCLVGRCASRHPPRQDTAEGWPSRDRTSPTRCGSKPAHEARTSTG